MVETILETILLVNKIPNRGSVVISEAFYVGVDIEVLPLVIGLVLNVPHPPLRLLPLLAPQILSLRVGTDPVGIAPELRNVSLIAPAN